MSTPSVKIVEKIEDQLAQVILYLGAIDALAEMYRSCEQERQDPFLFRTVYESLWDGVIVRVGTIWDGNKNVASLPQLSTELKRLKDTNAKAAAREIDCAKSPERVRLKEWRHSIIAHSSLSVDPRSFDEKNGICAEDVRREIIRIEQLLQNVNKCIGRSRVYYEVLKEDALVNARKSLLRWRDHSA